MSPQQRKEVYADLRKIAERVLVVAEHGSVQVRDNIRRNSMLDDIVTLTYHSLLGAVRSEISDMFDDMRKNLEDMK